MADFYIYGVNVFLGISGPPGALRCNRRISSVFVTHMPYLAVECLGLLVYTVIGRCFICLLIFR
jgi:hypothetical protein